jgi:hypothetical protein
MSTVLRFISAATDFVLTLNLKPAIVAAGFILMLMLTRREEAPHAIAGRPRVGRDTRASHVRVSATSRICGSAAAARKGPLCVFMRSEPTGPAWR